MSKNSKRHEPPLTDDELRKIRAMLTRPPKGGFRGQTRHLVALDEVMSMPEPNDKDILAAGLLKMHEQGIPLTQDNLMHTSLIKPPNLASDPEHAVPDERSTEHRTIDSASFCGQTYRIDPPMPLKAGERLSMSLVGNGGGLDLYVDGELRSHGAPKEPGGDWYGPGPRWAWGGKPFPAPVVVQDVELSDPDAG